MKEEELMKKLEQVELPKIELESHRRRLRMALLDSGYFRKRQEVTFMELVKSQTKGAMDTIWSGLAERRPVWKVALATAFAMLLIFTLVISGPSLLGLKKASVIPEGTMEIGGPQLTEQEEEMAMTILMADPGVRELLNQGAVIHALLPLDVTLGRINEETGETEEVSEIWAQAWINLGDQQWGAVVDLVRGKVESLTE